MWNGYVSFFSLPQVNHHISDCFKVFTLPHSTSWGKTLWSDMYELGRESKSHHSWTVYLSVSIPQGSTWGDCFQTAQNIERSTCCAHRGQAAVGDDGEKPGMKSREVWVKLVLKYVVACLPTRRPLLLQHHSITSHLFQMPSTRGIISFCGHGGKLIQLSLLSLSLSLSLFPSFSLSPFFNLFRRSLTWFCLLCL